jgi:hypothetical protein
LGAIGGVQKQQAKKARSPQKELQRAAAARQRKIWESEVTADLLEEKVRRWPLKTAQAAAARAPTAVHKSRVNSRPLSLNRVTLVCLYLCLPALHLSFRPLPTRSAAAAATTQGCFDMTQAEAARQLGFMSPTTLKKAMGRLGIKQWPNRKRSTVKNLIAGLEVGCRVAWILKM